MLPWDATKAATPAAFVFDLDGTGLTTEGKPSPGLREAIDHAFEAHVPVMIATSRSEDKALGYAQETGLTDAAKRHSQAAYVIHSMGGGATDATTGQRLFTSLMDPADARTFIEAGLALDKPMMIGTPDGTKFNRYPAPEVLNAPARRGNFDGAEQTPDLVQFANRATSVRVSEATVADMPSLEKSSIAMKNAYGIDELTAMPLDVDKGSGVQQLAQRLHLDLAHVYFFGDSNVDVPAFNVVGVPVAVANANADTMPHARFVTDSNDNGGVAKVMESALQEAARRALANAA